MKLVEQLGDLDPALAQRLEQAVDTVRQEFEEKLTSTVRETVAEETARISAEQLADEQSRGGTAEAASEASADFFDTATELRLAALDIDVAASQAEILEALSRSALRFASRVAIFVNRGDELHGWSASGFGDSDATIKNSVLAGDQVAPEGADRSTGSIALDSEECRVVCDALDAELPAMGLLMPFVLGNQIVGTVYCDRLGNAPFSVPALQLLTYLAGQTLETLSVRKRSSTATLNLAGAPASSAAGAGVATEAPEPQPPSEPQEAEAPEHESAEAAPVPEETARAPEEIEAPPVSVSDVLDQPDEAAPPEPAAPDTEEPAPAAIAEPDGVELGPLAEPAPEPALEAPVEAEEAPPAAPSTPEPPAPADSPQTMGAPPVDPAEPPVALGDTSVAPPDDVEGPGWAFTAPAPAADSSSDSGSEEAQRLARLLVTEIKLYNEEAVEEGRRNANIYARLQEDIDRSRQIFEDRIEESTRAQEDHFKQALVKILAGGDPALLGI